MAAGAAIAVVGWWTGYKLGGVVALFTAELFENFGIANYWQLTFLVLGILIILMNIGLLFVHEPIETDRQKNQIHHYPSPLPGRQQPLPERLKVPSKELDMPR